MKSFTFRLYSCLQEDWTLANKKNICRAAKDNPSHYQHSRDKVALRPEAFLFALSFPRTTMLFPTPLHQSKFPFIACVWFVSSFSHYFYQKGWSRRELHQLLVHLLVSQTDHGIRILPQQWGSILSVKARFARSMSAFRAFCHRAPVFPDFAWLPPGLLFTCGHRSPIWCQLPM